MSARHSPLSTPEFVRRRHSGSFVQPRICRAGRQDPRQGAVERLVRPGRDHHICHRGRRRAADCTLWGKRGCRRAVRSLDHRVPTPGPTISDAIPSPRLIYGARNTVSIAFVTTCLAFLIGGGAGLLAAAVGGWLDQVLARAVDVLMAIPQLIFAMLLLTIFGTSVPTLIVIIAVLDSTRVFRLARAAGMNIVVMDFVEVAELRGQGLGWIVRREILPNILPPLIAEFGMRFCFVFLLISSLSFLDIGIQPPTADAGDRWFATVDPHRLWRHHAASAGRGDRAADGGRELRRRLDPARDERASR